jgi:N-acetylmuramoyl-L-alanine amidase
MPEILVETAFIDNEEDVQLLINNKDDFARAIARGVTDYEVQRN